MKTLNDKRERNIRMLKLRNAGYTYRRLASQFDLTIERVRQIMVGFKMQGVDTSKYKGKNEDS